MTTRRQFVAALLLGSVVGTIGGTTTAEACGHCHGDKVAAVYDHAVVTQALKDGHAVEFAEVTGKFPPNGSGNDALKAAVEKIRGVDKGTVRVSANPAAVSFAFDPRQGTAADMLSGINGRIKKKEWSLSHLQTIGGP